MNRDSAGELHRFRRELEILERRIDASEFARSEMKAKLIETENALQKEVEDGYLAKAAHRYCACLLAYLLACLLTCLLILLVKSSMK